MEKPKYNVVSFSGGKDSTAMLIGMLERKMPIDCVLFNDTGLEFPAMYEHINRVEQNTGIEITRIKPERSFEYLLLEHPFIDQKGIPKVGYSWAGARMRWCTSKLKDAPREKFLRPLRKEYDVIEYVGIAADEQFRLERKRNRSENHAHPLVDWGMTEQDCLDFCYKRGYDWSGLYEHFKRVSCWCCPLQSLEELRQLYRHYPELWEQLKEWDNRTWRNFRADFSVEQLERRFDFENECIKRGLPINNRAFFAEMRKKIEAE
ncbi:MAG: phosphoadenosine phosphosulfate reductase family protein [Ruminococcus sp.]|nr:phosphoadenosine phosphosulfate reductase family protein [Ruminococcus sp.]